MPYLDDVTAKRTNQAQQRKESEELDTMLTEMKKMQLASLMGSGKSTVILTDQTDLGDKLKEMNDKVVKAIEAIEKPEFSAPDAVTVINQVDNTKELKDLLQAIKALKLDTVVNNPEPKVTVNTAALNLQPLQATIREALSTRESIVVEHNTNIDRYDLSRYRAVDIKDGTDTQYVGFVNPEGNWYIIENKVRENSMRFVFGTSGYSKHFKSAGQYSYQLLDKAIKSAT